MTKAVSVVQGAPRNSEVGELTAGQMVGVGVCKEVGGAGGGDWDAGRGRASRAGARCLGVDTADPSGLNSEGGRRLLNAGAGLAAKASFLQPAGIHRAPLQRVLQKPSGAGSSA